LGPDIQSTCGVLVLRKLLEPPHCSRLFLCLTFRLHGPLLLQPLFPTIPSSPFPDGTFAGGESQSLPFITPHQPFFNRVFLNLSGFFQGGRHGTVLVSFSSAPSSVTRPLFSFFSNNSLASLRLCRAPAEIVKDQPGAFFPFPHCGISFFKPLFFPADPPVPALLPATGMFVQVPPELFLLSPRIDILLASFPSFSTPSAASDPP